MIIIAMTARIAQSMSARISGLDASKYNCARKKEKLHSVDVHELSYAVVDVWGAMQERTPSHGSCSTCAFVGVPASVDVLAQSDALVSATVATSSTLAPSLTSL